MKRLMIFLALFFIFVVPVFAVEVAPRISDREIIENLIQLKAEHKSIYKRFDSIDKRLDDMNNRFGDMNNRFGDMNDRFGDMNDRFNSQQNIMIFIAMVFIGILGYLIRMQRHLEKSWIKIETSLEIQKDEIAWLKEMINKLLPPKGVL